MKKIPQVAHFVWGNPSGIPLSRYLSIASFASCNPDFDIRLHLFDTTYSNAMSGFVTGEVALSPVLIDYSEYLEQLPNLVVVNHKCSDYGLDSELPPAFMSDILRYHILYEYGGLYFDSDIIFFHPLSSCYLFSSFYSHINAIISSSHIFPGIYNAFRIGFLGSSSRNPFFLRAFEIALHNFDRNEYQSCGAPCISMATGGNHRKGKRNFCSEAFPEVYIHNVLDSLFYRFNQTAMITQLTADQFSLYTNYSPWFNGIHWYGGSFSEEFDSLTSTSPNVLPTATSLRLFDYIFNYAVDLCMPATATENMGHNNEQQSPTEFPSHTSSSPSYYGNCLSPSTMLTSDLYSFWQTTPFPHFILNGALQQDLFLKISSLGFNDVKPEAAYESEIESGKSCYSLSDVDEALISIVNFMGGGGKDRAFMDLLESYYGGIQLFSLLDLKASSQRSFIHQMRPGGILGSHIDQTTLTGENGETFVHCGSAIYYFSETWSTAWGGNTTFFGNNGLSADVSVPYKPNSICFFYHDSHSWHGVSRISSDAACTRKSVYMDYYVKSIDLPRLRSLYFGLTGKHASFRDHDVTFIDRKGVEPYTTIWQRYLDSKEI